MTLQELKRKKETLQKQLESAKNSLAVSEGKMQSFFDRLKKDYEIEDYESAEEFIEEQNKKITKLEKEKKTLEANMDRILKESEGNSDNASD